MTLKHTLGAFVVGFSILAAACTRGAPADAGLSPEILAEVNRIRAIDNHAHPVRVTGQGEAADRDFDALPVDNMEPASDPLQLRSEDPGVLAAWQALWNYPYQDMSEDHVREWKAHKQRSIEQKAEGYPAWVLDQMGVDVMLANRVRMGSSVTTPRFQWVPYADALIFPLDNSGLAGKNSDRKAFFADENNLLHRFLGDLSLARLPDTLEDYLRLVVTPILERSKQSGALAQKFEAAYLRSLAFDKVDRAAAAKVYGAFVSKGVLPDDAYKQLQDFLFRYIASECGRLNMAVHVHAMAGAGSYFDVEGANPLQMESLFNDPELRRTKFVIVHGGWPFNRESTALLTKPNVFLDFSAQSLLMAPATLAVSIREWLEWVPEKIMFGTDAYPYSDALGWEESGWLAARRGREALARALTAMLRDGEISRDRASQLARLVLRDNARKLYGL